MRANLLCGAIVFGLSAVVSSAHAAPPEIYPLDKIRRGQKGYGLTTMKGTTPERFTFEVIGVQKNFLPKMDIILVKSDDPKLAITGFWAGMSGSPLFIEGKLACAFAYAWRFSKIAIGGCTPIDYMKREGFKPPRRLTVGAGVHETSRRAKPKPKMAAPIGQASWREWRRLTPSGDINAALDALGPPRQPWLFRTPLPQSPARASASAIDDRGMVAASVPMAMSGFSSPAFAQAKKLLAGYPVEPMLAGGTGSSNSGPTDFTMGGGISVQLMRGDMSMGANGTVSYIDRDRVLAFGHPLFQIGETYAPVATTEVHAIMPSALSSHVIAAPMRELGSLVQDRKSTIMADKRVKTHMIPMRIRVAYGQNGSRERGSFDVELLNNRFFTAALAGIAAGNATTHFLPDRDHVTAKIVSKVSVRGYKPLSFTDYLYSETGAGGIVRGARGLRVLVPLLLNPFSPVQIDRIDLDIDLRFDTNFGAITEIRLPQAELDPGSQTYVDVTMRRYNGDEISERIAFEVPAKLAGSLIQLTVGAGDAARIDVAPPESLDDLVAAFRQLLPGNVFAVTLQSADEGVALEGKLIRDLPASALDKLRTSTRTTATKSYRVLSRTTKKSSRVINGSRSILVKIKNRR